MKFETIYTETGQLIIRIVHTNNVTYINPTHVVSTKRTQDSESYGSTARLYVYTIDGREQQFSDINSDLIESLQDHIMGEIFKQ